ncbi:YHS domain-containing protein [Agrococcus lahaulensis]|uniref:YHS domain-containing protein n=1 Tax=Agrococcus TaxID=46352 RepID=UPI000FE33023|nr:YHS domain-containing protein [Agrococcus sp. SCSIO52902]RWR22657.1 YHS domain-containing protein [Agrococcus lahaulensis]UOW00688.1 YHS domain-containing protein [Agrococcus sp. SCSIO52902]
MSNTTGHDHNHDHSNHEDHSHSHSATDAHGHGAAAGDIAECPVMAGSTVLKADAEAAGLVRDYEGTRYYLCCAACGPLFDADPAKYATAA